MNRASRALSAALGGGLTFLLLASACNQTPADTRAADEAAIREVDAAWSKAAAARDLDATLSYYADDARVLVPNGPLAATKESIRAAWASMLVPEMSVSWQADKVEVARSGDLGYATGTYLLTAKDPQGKSSEEKGKTLAVFRKQPDGKWKAIVDAFNSDLPMLPPQAAKKK